VLTHRMILREVRGGETDVQYLRIYIRSLRRKIEPKWERPRHIVTETEAGYRLRLLDPPAPDAGATSSQTNRP
ncbi:MAG: winged helix-turn-helix domain-containing protein, partial [Acetobacteraceae bacterium]